MNGRISNRLAELSGLCHTRLSALCVLLLCVVVSITAASQELHLPVRRINTAKPDSIAVVLSSPIDSVNYDMHDVIKTDNDSIIITLSDSELTGELIEESSDSVVSKPETKYDQWEEREVVFNPDPLRAVWLSALFPGLGQLYNRRYWKLPIVIGAYMGLGYATTWNNGMLTDYTKAYRDIMDTDPTTNSYMNFFPPTTHESDLDKTWLTNILQSRKNYFRRNRDLCIIAMVGVYLVAMVDAYVDASLSHFDITPELSLDVTPVMFQEVRGMKPSVGFMWAFNF